jgi:hypothetical protein
MANDDGGGAAGPSVIRGEEDIALEEPDVFWRIVSRMHIFGCAACLALYVMTRVGVEAIEGWWIVCTPFFVALPYSKYRLHVARKAMRLKQE